MSDTVLEATVSKLSGTQIVMIGAALGVAFFIGAAIGARAARATKPCEGCDDEALGLVVPDDASELSA